MQKEPEQFFDVTVGLRVEEVENGSVRNDIRAVFNIHPTAQDGSVDYESKRQTVGGVQYHACTDTFLLLIRDRESLLYLKKRGIVKKQIAVISR